MFIFDDRVEIINPGNLPDHLTIEKIRVGNSIQRNPILASFTAKGLLPYRGLGTGVRRALQDWPQIEFIDDCEGCLFTSCVQRIKIQTSAKEREIKVQNAPINAHSAKEKEIKVQNAPINASLSPLQKQILKILSEDPKASYEFLVTKLGKDKTTIMRNIHKLKDSQILSRSGSKKTGYWKILIKDNEDFE